MISQIFAPLHLAVTLTFDPLTLNFCSTSGVGCCKFVNTSQLNRLERLVSEMACVECDVKPCEGSVRQ